MVMSQSLGILDVHFAAILFGKAKPWKLLKMFRNRGLSGFVKEDRPVSQSSWDGEYSLGQVLSFFWALDFSCIKWEVGTQFSKFLGNNKTLGFGECLQPAF